jgi:hypothetical protein
MDQPLHGPAEPRDLESNLKEKNPGGPPGWIRAAVDGRHRIAGPSNLKRQRLQPIRTTEPQTSSDAARSTQQGAAQRNAATPAGRGGERVKRRTSAPAEHKAAVLADPGRSLGLGALAGSGSSASPMVRTVARHAQQQVLAGLAARGAAVGGLAASLPLSVRLAALRHARMAEMAQWMAERVQDGATRHVQAPKVKGTVRQ